MPATPAPGASANFDASGSNDLEGTITDYSWDFGDGSQPVDAGATRPRTHAFTPRGTYPVTLTITNGSNQTDQITQNVTVDNPPTAAFSPSATVATPGSSLSFDGTASVPGDGGTITHYIWDFGDGSQPDDTGHDATDSHVYPLPGSTRSRLTVTDDLGITSTATQVVTIDQPSAAFTAAADDRGAELTGELRRERLDRSRRARSPTTAGTSATARPSMPAQRDHDASLRRLAASIT